MPSPGDLRERVAFQYRAQVDDGAGNTIGDWTTRFERAAQVKAQRGREHVFAAKLEGIQPYVITVRFDGDTRTITQDWRIMGLTGIYRDLPFKIMGGIENPDMRRRYIDIVCEAGIAT